MKSGDYGRSPADAGSGHSDKPEPVPVSALRASVPNAFAGPLRITNFAPSYRQFRLSEDLTPEEITKALGFEPTIRPPGGKVTMEWKFWAEATWFNTPEVGHGSVSTCCKIWDYDEGDSRWSAYGWPEAFEQVGLTPLLEKDYGNWVYREDGNQTLPLLAQGIETRRAETEGLGAEHESPVGGADAP